MNQAAAGEVLLVVPLRHPLQLVFLHRSWHVLLVRSGLGVLLHVLPRRHELVPVLHGRLQARHPHLVREGALAREHVVDPLRKEPAMQRNGAIVGRRDLLKLRSVAGAELNGVILVQVRLRGHIAHDCQDLARRGRRARHLGLDLPEQALALVDTANEVVLPRDDAVGGGLDVVGDDHLLALPGRCLVKRAELPQVGLRLAETPLRVHCAAVELGERHTAGVVGVHRHEGILHGGALRVPEVGEGRRDGANHPVRILEGKLGREGVVLRASLDQRRFLTLVRHEVDLAIDKSNDLPPLRDRIAPGPGAHEGVLEGLLVAAQHPVDHVDFQDLVQALIAE
mmetsp:Transcript_78997/g.178436  ORF Transcript_78997/g.178436 Transcript_78997/m.178436 type:complete len:339 (+) Transcript_78997:212-1228(+)